MKNFEYYYDLEEVYTNRATYRPKATSAGITAITGYVPSVASVSSKTHTDDADGEDVIDKDVPGDVRANVGGNGVYNTPTDQSWLTSDLSTTAVKKARKYSKNSSNNKVRKTSTSSSATHATSFDGAATQYMSRCYITAGIHPLLMNQSQKWLWQQKTLQRYQRILRLVLATLAAACSSPGRVRIRGKKFSRFSRWPRERS